MKCIAIDDEPLALEVIEDFCSKIDFLELVGSFTGAIMAMEQLSRQSIDLIFVDINMPRISGIEFVKSLSNSPLVVFTTAYSQHAAAGYDLDAIDYLVKPIPFDRFLKAANKARELYEARNNRNVISAHQNKPCDTAGYIFIKVEYSTVKVDLSDIQYIEGVKDYIKIVVKSKTKSYLSRISMKAIMEKLPHEEFIRVHKSYIVAISGFEKIENNRILIGDKRIPIGDSYRKEFYSLLDKK